MRLEGSCQCGKVSFTVESDTPYPFMYCFCSICRKTTGALTSNIMGKRETLEVKGRPYLKVFHAVIRARGKKPRRSHGERWFCSNCGTHLYLLDDDWPDGVWPNAAAIDTELPPPPENVRIMLAYKPAWVPLVGKGPLFQEYPELSIAEWHERRKLTGATARTATGKRPRASVPRARG